ncbi:hypothetical protein CV093_04980 [Oceanobacillus sp. 143]|nr:hypothetical protein CV093_04980 [Oceanobacillus sp. 143]
MVFKENGSRFIGVTDMDRSIDFYTRVCNLVMVEQDADGTAYLRSQFEHHALELRPSSVARLDHIAYETHSDAQTEQLKLWLEKKGVEVTEAPPEPGRLGKAIRFQDPNGTWIEVYRSLERLEGIFSSGPFKINGLGHLTLLNKNIEEIEPFYREVACFRLSDRRADNGAWMRCNADHHAIAFLPAENTTLHHHAYELESWNEMKRACDWFARQGIPVASGPMRHGIGNNIAIYIKDPDGFFVEYYCEMEQIDDGEDHIREHKPFVDVWAQVKKGVR